MKTLQNDFMLQLMETLLPVGTQCFMPDGATPLTANVVMAFMLTMFQPSCNVT
jgi:hypothetical protein